MISVSSWWVEQSLSLNSDLRRELLFTSSLDGETFDLSHLVKDGGWPKIKRKSGVIDPGGASITIDVNRLDQRFADFAPGPMSKTTVPYAHFGLYRVRVGYVHPTSGPEMIHMYSGRIKSKSWGDGTMTMKISPSSLPLNKSRIETNSGDAITLGFDPGVNAADMAWSVCSMSGMDVTESSANTDIDYAAFTSWESWITGLQATGTGTPYVELTASGQTGAALLRELMKQCYSIIALGGDGRLKIAKRIGLATPVGEIENDMILSRAYSEDSSKYPALTRGWLRDSQGVPGAPLDLLRKGGDTLYGFIGEDTETWKSEAVALAKISAGGGGALAIDAMLDRAAGYGYKIPMEAKIGLPMYGMLFDIGDEIEITDTVESVTSFHWTAIEVEADINKGTTTITAEERREDFTL